MGSFFSRISVRLLLFNLLLVVLPVAGFLYLGVFERQLLADQERSMVQQGRLLAAALSLQARGEEAGTSLEAAGAQELLRRLEGRTEARLRIVGPGGELLADSSLLGPRRAAWEEGTSGSDSYRSDASGRIPRRDSRDSLLYRAGAVVYRLAQKVLGPAEPAAESYYAPGRPLLGAEVRAALAGRYGAATRASGGGQRSLTLYSAIPVRGNVRGGGEVLGAVLVSQSTFRILRSLYDVRLDVSRVFLLSLAVAAVLSLLLSGTIARPLRRLRDEANVLLDRRGRLTGRFGGSRRSDEIGDLARALEQLTVRLETHLAATESFAADVSHELKNPLAAIRTATEMLAEVEDPADRARFLALAQREVARLERLLSGLREVTRLDARLDDGEPAPAVRLDHLVRELVEGFQQRAGRGLGIELEVPPEPLVVRAAPDRLAQVFENLLDNAAGFSPEGGRVTVTLERKDGAVVATVADRGPGIPESHRGRIFDRFFTYRPGTPKDADGHTGLGLAIVKAIVEANGGAVAARDRPGGGAVVEVRLPAAG